MANKKVMIYIPESLHKALKHRAVEQDSSVSEIVTEACENYLNPNHKEVAHVKRK